MVVMGAGVLPQSITEYLSDKSQVPSGAELGYNMTRFPVGQGIENIEIECVHNSPL